MQTVYFLNVKTIISSNSVENMRQFLLIFLQIAPLNVDTSVNINL